MPTRTSPFTKPEAIRPTIKALLKGPTGDGKTHMALKSPGPLYVIDSEGAAQWYVGRDGFEEFELLRTKSYDELKAAVEHLGSLPPEQIKGGTLVIDSISIFYATEQDAAIRAKEAAALAQGKSAFDVDIEGRDWNKISRLHKALMAKLMNLPMHVIVITRESEQKKKQGGEYVTVGFKAEANKGIESDFALIVRVEVRGKRRIATIEKDWTGVHGKNAEIEDPTWDTVFGPLLKVRQNAKATATALSDEDAARANAASFGTKLATPQQAAELVGLLSAAGYDPEEVRERRGWPPFTEMRAQDIDSYIAALKHRSDPAGQSTPPAGSGDPGALLENGEPDGPPDPTPGETASTDGSTETPSTASTSGRGRGRRKAAEPEPAEVTA